MKLENRFLEWLIQSKKVYYIYITGPHIYDLPNDVINFIVVCNKHTTFPKEFYNIREIVENGNRFNFQIKVDNYNFIFKTNEEWFNDVLNGSIEAWECACMNKKFIIKEHVKLLMKTDPLGLRKQVVKMDHLISPEKFDAHAAWKVIAYCKFANQIIENHKIVNFKEANSERKTILSGDYETYINCLHEPLTLLKKSTDGILKKELQKKIVQK